jgi:hypothetical protein
LPVIKIDLSGDRAVLIVVDQNEFVLSDAKNRPVGGEFEHNGRGAENFDRRIERRGFEEGFRRTGL